ncbi:M20/M25/M40 family metallo-hydrolase [Streptomyces noursei]|nr:M20/M25/M40 family metallo-hydrolase [Streptomyces noursei]
MRRPRTARRHPLHRLPRLLARTRPPGPRPRRRTAQGRRRHRHRRTEPPLHRPRRHRHRPPPTPDAPTVLLYAHYDVQPAADEHLWDSPPFEPTRIEGGIRARGIADDKVNLMVHLGALRAWRGRPPVGIKIVFEGQEEYGSAFDGYPPTDPTAFACDAMIIADTGNIRPGTPTLTTALRGSVDVFVDVRTLDSAVHSGQYGGAAPDALLVLVKALATLHDLHGDVAVEGLRREPWHGTALAEDDFRALAGVPDGTPLLGSGGLGERLWSGPALTVVGLDAPSADRGAAAVVPHARAKLNLRVHPGRTPGGPGRPRPPPAAAAPVRHPAHRHPRRHRPRLRGRHRRPAYRAARTALRRAWGAEPVDAAAGGSVPLVNGLATAVPQAEILLFGAADSLCRMHAPNERMLRSEFRGALLAEALFFAEYAAAHRPGGAA